MKGKSIETQVAIIGAGIVGAAIAREFSKYKVDVCLIEKEPEHGFGMTKGSQGLLHDSMGLLLSRIVGWFQSDLEFGPYMNQPLSMKESYDLMGLEIYRELEPILGAKVNWPGRVIAAENEAEMKMLKTMKEVAEKNMNADGLHFLDRMQLEEKEPMIDPKFVGGLWDPGEGVIFPAEWAKAFAENAKDNGTNILLDTQVTAIEERNGYWVIMTNKGSIKTEFVVNASGLHSDEILAMIDKLDFSWILMKCQLLVMENRDYIKHVVCGVHKPNTGRLLIPTTEGNILVSSGTSQGKNKYDLSTDKETIDRISGYPNHFFPAIPIKKNLISCYAAYMNFNSRNPGDYILECPKKRFINMLVCPPALSPAPILGKEAVKMAAEEGLELVKKNNFNPYRLKEPFLKDLPTEDKNEKIRDNPKYGHMICRCEKVSEQEVINTVSNGVTTLDGVKFETRAGMGRCQGGFCTSRVLKIIADELDISPLDIRKKGGASYILKSEMKTLGERH